MSRKRRKNPEIYPDEIFLDSKNIPEFNTQQFEGRIERPISKKTFHFLSLFLCVAAVSLFFKIFYIQIVTGETLTKRAEKNSLIREVIMPPRANIVDRNGIKIAWDDNQKRTYVSSGFSNLLGYIGLPSSEDLKNNKNMPMHISIGKEGLEKKYENSLKGTVGIKLMEKDSQGDIISESVYANPVKADDFKLAIDSRIQEQLFKVFDSAVRDWSYQGAAGVVLDINNGEVIALVNWPEYDSQVLSNGGPAEKIKKFFEDKRKPFLNRAVSGLYAPGSIIKPFVALAALNEGTIFPEKQILSAGSISIPNPFFPDKKSVFNDWKIHGWVDMREALAVSSDVYFYHIGGGYGDVKGIGINKIEEYAKKFGLDSKTGIDLNGELSGSVPNENTKIKTNPEDPIWRIGDTYNASIGQGYFHVTPIEIAVYTAALANGGKIIQPHLVLNNEPPKILSQVEIPEKYFKIVQEGMRMAVMEGTATALNLPNVSTAAKTGTAEVGAAKKYINSWIIGFFPL